MQPKFLIDPLRSKLLAVGPPVNVLRHPADAILHEDRFAKVIACEEGCIIKGKQLRRLTHNVLGISAAHRTFMINDLLIAGPLHAVVMPPVIENS